MSFSWGLGRGGRFQAFRVSSEFVWNSLPGLFFRSCVITEAQASTSGYISAPTRKKP